LLAVSRTKLATASVTGCPARRAPELLYQRHVRRGGSRSQRHVCHRRGGGAAQSAATGPNPPYGALIGAGFGAIGAYAGRIPPIPGKGFGTYLANAALEIGTEAGIGALGGGFTALANGGEFGEGAPGGAVFGASFGAAKVGLLGARAQPPYTREQIEAEFNRQSQWDQSGLKLALPELRIYEVRVGGLLRAIPGMRIQAVGTSALFSTYDSMTLDILAHELRHVAQLQALGVVPFLGEYATILPEQLRYQLTDPAQYTGGLYRTPGSHRFALRLEPWILPL